MTDRLVPQEGAKPLSPAQIVERLRHEFEYVAFDAEAGKESVGDMLATFVRMNASKQIIDFHTAAQPGALQIVFADDPDNEDAILQTVAMPGGDLFFSYHSGQHQRTTDPAVDKCARVLGYKRIRL